MSGLIYELIDILNSEADLYEKLLALSIKKNRVIINSDTMELSNITKLEQEAVIQLQNMERKREGLVFDISIVLNRNPSDLTISKLALILKGEYEQHDALMTVSEKIRVTLKKLKEMNDQNAELIKLSIDYIDFTINAIQSSHEAPRASYDYGQGKISESASFFDRKQ